jgi:hypothetical protein
VQGGRRVDSTVLFMNACRNVKTPLRDRAAHSRPICDTAPPDSCECPR